MRTALYSALLVGFVAGVIVLASSSVTRTSDGVKIGVRPAEACDKSSGPSKCLPGVDYLDTEGTMWTEETLAGKVVMINFWATWCAPCKQEVPALTSVYKKYKDQDFVLLGVMTDAPGGPVLKAFSERFNLDYPVVPVDRSILDAYEWPPHLPATFIYDRAGNLRLHHEGALDEPRLSSVIRRLVAEAPPTPPAPPAPAAPR